MINNGVSTVPIFVAESNGCVTASPMPGTQPYFMPRTTAGIDVNVDSMMMPTAFSDFFSGPAARSIANAPPRLWP